jgi:hypothetical protein
MMKFGKVKTVAPIILAATMICACGGGGGDSGSGNPPPPPPPASFTYSVQLVDAGLEDTVTGLSIDASGLPVNGATVRRD